VVFAGSRLAAFGGSRWRILAPIPSNRFRRGVVMRGVACVRDAVGDSCFVNAIGSAFMLFIQLRAALR
jgi:hypothetical protein